MRPSCRESRNMIAYNLRSKDILGLFTVIIGILYTPISTWIFHFDGAKIVPLSFYLFTFIVLFPDISKSAGKVPVVLYLLLAIYQMVNGILKDSYLFLDRNDGLFLITSHLLLPVLTLLFVSNVAARNFNYTIKMLAIGGVLYSFLCLFLSGLITNDRSASSINANEIALYCAIDLGLLILCYIRRVIKLQWLFIAIFPIFGVIVTSSRMGFLMILIMSVYAWIYNTKYSKHDLRFVVIQSLFLIMIIASIYGVLKYGEVGERLEMTTEQAENNDEETNTLFDYYGDRGAQYYFSWPYFLESPITGIGIGNWGRYNRSGVRCHSEILVQYLEGGLIAIILYLLFWIYIIKGVIRTTKGNKKNLLHSTALFILCILFLIFWSNTVLWSYDMHCVFVIYGLAIAINNKNTTRHRIIIVPS